MQTIDNGIPAKKPKLDSTPQMDSKKQPDGAKKERLIYGEFMVEHRARN